MDDRLQQETERQRRLLEEARKAVEQEKARLRQGAPRRIEPQLDAPAAFGALSPEPGLQSMPPDEARAAGRQERGKQGAAAHDAAAENVEPLHAEAAPLLRSIPEMRSALIPIDDAADGASWSKPFSLCRADMEPWLSFLRGYRQSCLFPETAPAEPGLRVDAAVQALFELKGLDLKLILEPAVQINGPVEYFDENSADIADGERDAHRTQLATAVERGREMGDRLYDALLGEGYANLVRAWEKVHNRKPSVSELHFMLTTGRIKPPAELQPRQVEAAESEFQPKATAIEAETVQKRPEATAGHGKAPQAARPAFLERKPEGRFFSTLKTKFAIRDKRRFLFHLSHLLLVAVALAVYFVVMRVFD